MDTRTKRGFWGRGLTQFSNCASNQTLQLTCTPLLECWTCSSNNTEGCFKEDAMGIETCGQDTTQCYQLKTLDTEGVVSIMHGCGVNTATEDNLKTCDAKRSAAKCGEDGMVCYCKECYGRLCNSSPFYKAAEAQTKAITGTISSVMYLMENLSTLLRVGMFDISVASGNSTG